ncbi:MAG: lamin tail domain-containing protein [Methanomassiliicoccaceae archaeon]|nr:lamin tail domain-containing protein [Methanomassiliicoccaceae archaeon]
MSKNMQIMRRDRRGQMPFAMIAVTILILAGTYGVVAASLNEKESNMDRMQDELDSVGAAIGFTKGYVERGIGDIILDMGRESATGDIEERSGSFGERLSKWMVFQFPLRANGAVVDIVSYDIELGIGSLKVASDDAVSMDGTRPSCFRADGGAVVSISTSFGSVVKDVYISADGMSALPLLLENASLFSAAVTGPRSLVTELMSYQLTALAQYRVMSGYGALSEYGEKGTNSIITDADVRTAYRIALSVAETTYLRSSSDDEYDLTDRDMADAAELLAFRDGKMIVDLGAVFSQTLLSIADLLVLGWMDYFMFSKVIEVIDKIVDGLRAAYNWLRKVVTGSEAETAQGYLSSTMSRAGIPESEYRYMLNGTYASLDLPAVSLEFGGNVVQIPGTTLTVGYPNVDVLSWDGWNGFMNRYYKERNQIAESLNGMIKAIAVSVSSSYGLGAVTIECDPFDGTDMAETMGRAVSDALAKQRSSTEDLMESVVRSYKVIDTMYVAIYEHIDANKDSVFGISRLNDSIRASIRAYVTGAVEEEHGTPLDPSVIDSAVDLLMGSDSVISITEQYAAVTGQRMLVFEDILNNVEKSMNSLFKDLAVIAVRYGMDLIGLYPMVEGMMKGLVAEMADFSSLGSMSGVYGLPGTDSFVLSDNKGNIVKEYVSVDSNAVLDVRITYPSKSGENVHYVGFFENHAASYSSMFRIDVTADLSYETRSSSSLMMMLGTYDSAVRGETHSEFDLAIAVMSGWALAGVRYEPSNTILTDAVMLFLKIIEPLLKPLYELKKLADNVLNLMTAVIMRGAEFVSDLLMKLYEVISWPLEKFAQLVDAALGSIVADMVSIINITLGSQTFGVEVHGMRLEVITDIAGELKKGTSTTKLKLTMPVRSVTLSATLELKKDKDGKFSITGRASASADTWNLEIAVDPLMKVRKSIVEIDGTFRGTDIHAVMPQLVQYDEFELRLSDIPGLGTILSNIPLPVPGMKGSLDAGFEIKYNLPYVYGVVINEFELNPPGTDSNNEWVELYNSTASAVDLEGYKIQPFSNMTRMYEIHDTVLRPGERTVITFPGQFLNNTRESITLFDADGVVVDYTPSKTDSKNDDLTWQRETDASANWVLKKQTKGEDNGGRVMGGSPVRAALVQCIISAGNQAFGEMGLKIVGPDGVALFLKRVIELTIENAINMIASCVVSASIFIELAVNDASGTAHSGIRFSLTLGKEIVQDGLRWAVGQITSMMNHIDNPTGMTPKQIISDDIYFRTMIFAQVTTPKILGSLGNKDGITAGIVVECNITALCTLFGKSAGTWKVNAGLLLEDVPPRALPPMMKADPDKNADLWLLRLTMQKAS